MAEDWLLARIDDVLRAAAAARAELEAAVDVLSPVRADRVAGVPLPTLAIRLAGEGAAPRHAVAAAYREYEQSVAALRAQVVRALVDEEGATISDLARRMGVSRQTVARLYETGGGVGQELSTD